MSHAPRFLPFGPLKPSRSSHSRLRIVTSSRPAKKRCQFRVIYNIPATPAADAVNEDGTPAGPTMTAEPTQCPSAAVKIVGDCPYCNKAHCGIHRTPESHNCTGMQACRDAAFQANKDRLERERTVANKIAQA